MARIEDQSLRDRTEKACLDRIKIARDQLVSANRIGVGFLFFIVSLLFTTAIEIVPRVWDLYEMERDRSDVGRYQGQALAARSNELGATRKETQYMDISFPGGIHNKVPSEAVPALILPISTCFVLYLNFARRRFLRQLACNLRILRDRVGYPSASLRNLAPSPPWWLAPLPRVKMKHGQVTPSLLHAAVGWDSGRRRIYRNAYLVYGLFCVFQISALITAWLITRVVWRDGSPLQFVYVEIAAFFGMAGLLVGLDWFRPRHVPDHQSRLGDPDRWTRRQVMVQGATLCVATGAIPIFNILRSMRSGRDLLSLRRGRQAVATGQNRSPRFRRKRRHIDLPQYVVSQLEAKAANAEHCGLLNLRSGVLHLCRKENGKWLFDGKGAPPTSSIEVVEDYQSAIGKALVDVQPHDRQPLAVRLAAQPGRARSLNVRPERNRGPFTAERLARKLIGETSQLEPLSKQWQDKAGAACALLNQSLNGSASDLRLLDFLAAIALRFDLKPWQAMLTQRLQQVRPSHPADAGFKAAGWSVVHAASGPTPAAATQNTRWVDLVQDLWLRLSTGVRPTGTHPAGLELAGRVRRRARCRAGVLAPREAVNRKTAMGSPQAIASRKLSWFEPTSSWRKRHAEIGWQWGQPQAAAPCREG